MAERAKRRRKTKEPKHLTRYTHDTASDPATPETGHTALIGEEQVVSLPMDNGWSEAVEVGKLSGNEETPVIVDMDPAVDPILFWAGKRNRREVPLLPLQRNDIVSESRIARIIERSRERAGSGVEVPEQQQFFSDLEKALRESDKDKRIEFYTHEEDWKNKLICGDSLEVMESLIHYENLRGKVQMIYVDPPYGISYDSNFQQRIDTSRNAEKDRGDDVLTIKAYRDTWTLGIHSYLSYLQERLYLGRELLSETGSIFVQINDEHLPRVRLLLDEVFGAKNHFATVVFSKTTGFTDKRLSGVYDCLLWYAKDIDQIKYLQLYQPKPIGREGAGVYTRVELPDGTRRKLTNDELENLDELPEEWRVYRLSDLSSQGAAKEPQPFEFQDKTYYPSPNSHWKTTADGLKQLAEQRRIEVSGKSLAYVRYYDDFPVAPIANIWMDTGTGSFTEPKFYAVQTGMKVLLRCIALTTDPGDIVFDPTCGSGTTALCAERLGRRWVTCDTSRVAINIARQRLLSGVYEHYRTRNGTPSSGFQYNTVDRRTLKSVAYGLEPEKVELCDQPEPDPSALRVTGPFEVMTLGRYSVEDWKGYLVDGREGFLEDYITVVSRLYRKEAALQESLGVIHAIADSDDGTLGISVGPISGRVTARQIYEAMKEAEAGGIEEVHVLGWAFEANVGEVKAQLETEGKVRVQLIMIRPDSLAEGLKVTQPEMLFSPLALPDVDVLHVDDGELQVTLKGVALFDRKSRVTEYKPANSGYVAAWYLDEDYDGDCFVDCQMFFDFKKKPAIEKALGIEVDAEEWALRLTSDPFKPGKYGRAAVKVVDVYGNEATVVKDLA